MCISLLPQISFTAVYILLLKHKCSVYRNKTQEQRRSRRTKPRKMLTFQYEMVTVRNLSLIVFLLCVVISLKNQNSETKKGYMNHLSSSSEGSPSILSDVFPSTDDQKLEGGHSPRSSEYGFYRETCRQAEKLIQPMVRYLYKLKPSVAPPLLRLAFHDCFIEGCDASVLLDGAQGIDSEKDSPPSESLKGFDVIDIIKSELEDVCPGVVSCADILVLAAREAVFLAGGPYYPLNTGRRDGTLSYLDIAADELPSAYDDLSEILASFASRGFDERETVSLLGAHSIGLIHCNFFQNRLYDFDGTGEPDPTVDSEFLNLMRSTFSVSPSSTTISSVPSPSPLSSSASPPFYGLLSSSAGAPSSSADGEQGMGDISYEGAEANFGQTCYRSLLQGKGILYADQQLMAGEQTGIWVRAYASDASLFQRDFALAMMKLSNLQVLTEPRGQIRLNCSKVA